MTIVAARQDAKAQRLLAPWRLGALAPSLFSSPMLRYVILEHDWPQKHWDFMLEAGDVLQTWRLPTPPATGMEISAEKSFDHRLMYLDYEGPISDDRGSVVRWDAGSYEVMVEDSHARSRRDLTDRCVIQLEGKRLQGTLEMTCQEGTDWIFRFQCPTND